MLKTDQFVHIWKSCVWGPEKGNVAITAIKQLIFKNRKSHAKKLNSLQYFGHILTDNEIPAIKCFRTGLLKYACMKIQKLTRCLIFLMIFGAENSFLKKLVLNSVNNWLFWTHFWIPFTVWFKNIGLKPGAWSWGFQHCQDTVIYILEITGQITA